MGIAIHIFKKDLRRLWPLLVILFAYIGILTAVLTTGLRSPDPNSIEWTSFVQSSGLLGTGSLWILTAVVIVFLIHEEPPSGTSAFWLTRPIPRGSLLAAKAGFIFLFLVAVPAAANLYVLSRYGLEANRIGPSLAKMLSAYLIFIGINVALAVLTSSLQAFVIACLGTMLLVPLGAKFLRIDVPMNLPFWIAKILIPGTLTGVVCLIVILHQYLTRRTRRSVTILVAGLILTVPSANWAENTASMPLSPSSGGATIGLAVMTAPEGSVRYVGPERKAKQRIVGALDLVKVPDDAEVWLTSMSGQLDFPGGNALGYKNHTVSVYGDPLAGLLPGFTGASTPKATTLVDLLAASDEVYREWGSRPGTYSGVAQLQTYRYVTKGSLPLKSGEHLETGSDLVEVSKVTLEQDDLYVTMSARSLDGVNLSFYIFNRKLRQVLGSDSAVPGSSRERQLILPGVSVSYWSQYLKLNMKHNPYAFTVDEQWLADAEVLVAERFDAGRFSRTFQIRDFRMSENTLEQWQQRSRKKN